jgi:hypothetical protein
MAFPHSKKVASLDFLEFSFKGGNYKYKTIFHVRKLAKSSGECQ